MLPDHPVSPPQQRRSIDLGPPRHHHHPFATRFVSALSLLFIVIECWSIYSIRWY